jgi:hypothetical protein
MFETNVSDALAAIAVLLFFAVLFIAAGVRRDQSQKGFSILNSLHVLALLPSGIALWSTIIFATSSFLLPSRLLYGIGPVIIFILALKRILKHSSNLELSQPQAAGKLGPPWAWVVLSLMPIAAAIAIEALRIRSDNDISLYLFEASYLSLAMREGFSTPLGWMGFGTSSVSHPHSLSFSHYLAFGFLASDGPGFGSDLTPRVLIGFSRVSFLAAVVIVPMILMRNGISAGLLALAFVVFDESWRYQMGAASRDVAYLAPFLVMSALLLRALPKERSTNIIMLASISVWGTLMGHTLGLVYAAPVVFTIAIFKLFQYRSECLKLKEFWIASGGILLLGANRIKDFFVQSEDNLGFAYPFYSADPALLELWERSRFVTSTFSDFVKEIYLRGPTLGALIVLLISIVLAIGLFISSSYYRKNYSKLHIRIAIPLLAVFIATNLAILVFPVELNGVSLSSAFVANFRYTLGLKSLLFLTASMSIISLFNFAFSSLSAQSTKAGGLNKLFTPRNASIGSTLGLMLIFVGGFKSYSEAYDKIIPHTNIAFGEFEACNLVQKGGAQKILLERGSIVYRCSVKARPILSRHGVKVLSARGDTEISSVLSGENIDAFILTPRGISDLWINTHFYDFLSRKWVRINMDEYNTIFLSPALKYSATQSKITD